MTLNCSTCMVTQASGIEASIVFILFALGITFCIPFIVILLTKLFESKSKKRRKT
jgi:hypothetical protein